MTPEEHRARGIRAEQLLDDEILRATLDRLEADAVDTLARTDVADYAALQRAVAALQATRTFRDELTTLIRTGRLAADRLDGEPPRSVA